MGRFEPGQHVGDQELRQLSKGQATQQHSSLRLPGPLDKGTETTPRLSIKGCPGKAGGCFCSVSFVPAAMGRGCVKGDEGAPPKWVGSPDSHLNDAFVEKKQDGGVAAKGSLVLLRMCSRVALNSESLYF